jgi:energy-coupling factor transporter ATP-binding protein EcfA2
MRPQFNTLSIERFRAFRHLNLENLGRVNLITGRNNTGKSSVLEAFRILASEASPSVIFSILRSREENAEEVTESTLFVEAISSFPLSSLFHDFPPFTSKLAPIKITATGEQRSMTLSMETGWYTEERDSTGLRKLLLQQPGLFGEDEGLPALLVEANGVPRIIPMEAFSRRVRLRRPESSDRQSMPCVFVSPYGGEHTATLGNLWDNIALSDREQDVVEALRIIDPEISAVSMVGGEGSRPSRTAIVKSAIFPRPVSLRSFGDGLNRLFGIILSLVNAKDGFLLIDEFENGMHYSVLADTWRAVFRLANSLNIQVVATSHSWDAIEAFQLVASEDPAEGVLIRLSRKGEDIIPTVFREDELAIATRDRIEVR